METVNSHLVSIVVRTHNRSQLLNEALISLTSQTYRPIEILVVDHNSTDNTKEIVDSFGKQVRYYKHTGSFRDTFNVWRKLVKGEFISFHDDDDYIRPNCIEKLINLLILKKDIDVVFSRKRFFSVHNDRCNLIEDTHVVDYRKIKKSFLRSNVVHWNSVMIRKHCLSAVPTFDKTVTGAFDYLFMVYIATAGFKFYQIDEILGFIRRSPDSVQFEIERMSKGEVECRRYLGKQLSFIEKFSLGYWRIYGYHLIRYGLILTEKGKTYKGRLILMKGVFLNLFSLKERKTFFIAVLLLIFSFVSNPVKSWQRIEKLFGTYLFRNYLEIEKLKKQRKYSRKYFL